MPEPVIAVTGANGFVGSLIVKALEPHARIIRLVRNPLQTTDIAWSFDTEPTVIEKVLREHGVTCLIHAAWDMQSHSTSTIERDCVKGSIRLLESARSAGVQKLIFISTISAFPGARSAYGKSKLAIERAAIDQQGIVLRLGLVYGSDGGGLFGKLGRVVAGTSVVPVIGDGAMTQYLLHEDTLAEVIRRAVDGDFDTAEEPLTIAQPEGISFCDLLRQIAARQGKKIRFIKLPWWLVFWTLKLAETAKIPLNFRSDNVLGLVFQNRTPDFDALRRYSIEPVRF